MYLVFGNGRRWLTTHPIGLRFMFTWIFITLINIHWHVKLLHVYLKNQLLMSFILTENIVGLYHLSLIWILTKCPILQFPYCNRSLHYMSPNVNFSICINSRWYGHFWVTVNYTVFFLLVKLFEGINENAENNKFLTKRQIVVRWCRGQ